MLTYNLSLQILWAITTETQTVVTRSYPSLAHLNRLKWQKNTWMTSQEDIGAKPQEDAQWCLGHLAPLMCTLAFGKKAVLQVPPDLLHQSDSWPPNPQLNLEKSCKTNLAIRFAPLSKHLHVWKPPKTHDIWSKDFELKVLWRSIMASSLNHSGKQSAFWVLDSGVEMIIYPPLSRIWMSSRIAQTDLPASTHSDSVSTALLSLHSCVT